MNHKDAMTALTGRGIPESYANSMLSYAFNNGWCRKLLVTVEYSGPAGYTISS